MPLHFARHSWLPLALVSLGLTSLPASAATHTVPSQYTTIQAAMNASVNGDIVLISDGTYTGPGNVDLDFGGRNITVTSQNGPATTIIDCQGTTASSHRGFTLYGGSAVISGLTIKNGSESNSSGGAILVNGAGATIQNCIFSGNSASYGGGLYSYNTGTLLVTGCQFIGNTASGGGGLIILTYGNTSSDQATVSNCTLTGNTVTGYGGGMSLFGSTAAAINVINCTVTANSAAGSDGGIDAYSPNAGAISLTNSIVYGDTGGEIYASGASITNCDIQGGAAGTGNINADPLFAAAPADLHLQAGSPCLGAGTPGGAPATTLDGLMRPNPPSIGAYEAAVPVAQYTYKTIDAPGAGATSLGGINNLSQVVGDSSPFQYGYPTSAFLDSGGVFTPENDLATAPSHTIPAGINDFGQITGMYTDLNYQNHAYVENNGVFTTIDVPDSVYQFVAGINDAGQVAGYYADSTNRYHGFVYAHGTFTTVDAPNSTSTTLSGINNLGQLLGVYYDAKGPHYFVETNGVYKDVAVPAAFYLSLYGINDFGQIIGATYDTSYKQQPFVITDGVAAMFTEPGAFSGNFNPVVLTGINDAGQIVGFYNDAQYQEHGFVATPQVPFAPTGLTATATRGKIALHWTAPPGLVFGYSISRGTTAGGETHYKSVGAGATFTDTRVKSGTAYYYTVKAINAAGVSPASNEAVAALVPLPGAPSYLSAYATPGLVTLSWIAPAGAVSGYNILRGTAAGGETFYKSVGAVPYANRYDDAAVTSGKTYYYKVKAVNSAGTGPASYEASAKP